MIDRSVDKKEKQFKLCAVRIVQYQDERLEYQDERTFRGIQLELSDGEGWILDRTLFSQEKVDYRITKLKKERGSIDISKTISQVSIMEDSGQFYGLRFTDSSGEVVYEKREDVISKNLIDNCLYKVGWQTKEIPKGWHIIGVRCSISGPVIERIGFVLTRTMK